MRTPLGVAARPRQSQQPRRTRQPQGQTRATIARLGARKTRRRAPAAPSGPRPLRARRRPRRAATRVPTPRPCRCRCRVRRRRRPAPAPRGRPTCPPRRCAARVACESACASAPAGSGARASAAARPRARRSGRAARSARSRPRSSDRTGTPRPRRPARPPRMCRRPRAGRASPRDGVASFSAAPTGHAQSLFCDSFQQTSNTLAAGRAPTRRPCRRGGRGHRFATKVTINVYDLTPRMTGDTRSGWARSIRCRDRRPRVHLRGRWHPRRDARDAPGATFREAIVVGTFDGGQPRLRECIEKLQRVCARELQHRHEELQPLRRRALPRAPEQARAGLSAGSRRAAASRRLPPESLPTRRRRGGKRLEARGVDRPRRYRQRRGHRHRVQGLRELARRRRDRRATGVVRGDGKVSRTPPPRGSARAHPCRDARAPRR